MGREYNRGTLLERTWARIEKGRKKDCWLFRGSKGNYGYGQIRDGKKLRRAHVVIYESVYGLVPRGKKVLHRCDNPPCCNPSHLFVGTQQENVDDMIAKGRDRKAKGLENGKAKLSDEDVKLIRRLHENGVGHTELGRRFGISRYYTYCLTTNKDRV